MKPLSARHVVVLAIGLASALVWCGVAHAQGGVVVEDVSGGSAGEKADIRVGDVLLTWERSANPPANAEKAEGTIESVFDWTWVEIEQGPRGSVTVAGERDGKEMTFEVPMGNWGIKVRPRFDVEALKTYMEGRAAVDSKELERAISLWDTVGESAASVMDMAIACWISLRIGDTWAEARRWKEAQTAYESARGMAETATNPVVHALIWDLIGQSLERQTRFGDAEKAYASAIALREKVENESLSVARSLNFIGGVAWNRGDLATAEGYFKRALAIREKLAPDSLAVATSVNNLGVVAFNRGEAATAAVYYERALAIRERLAPDSLDVAASLNSLGNVADARGDLAVAESYHQRALAIKEKLAPDSLDVAASLNNLGITARHRDEFATAEAYYRRALAILEKRAPNSLDLARSLNNLGIVARNRGELPTAETYYTRALSIYEKLAPDRLDLAISLHNLALVARARGDLSTAEAYSKRALGIQEKLAPDSLNLSASLSTLGMLAGDRGDLPAAEVYHKQALGIRETLAPGSSDEAESQHDLGLLYRQTSQTRLAVGHLRRAVDALEAQVAKVGGSQEAQSGFGVQFVDFYRDYIDLLIELNQPAEAFHILERSRARTLLAMLAERDLVFAVDVPEDVERERKQIAWEYDRAQARLTDLNPLKEQAQIEDVLNRIRELRDRQSTIAERIRRQSPRLASLQYPQPLDVNAVQAGLDRGTLLVSYSVHKEKSYLFALTRDAGLRVYTLAIGEARLREEVERFRTLIQRAQLGATDLVAILERGRYLYDLLIRPVATAAESAERVMVIPDGPLQVLPFAALVRGDVKSGSVRRNWQYLIEWKPMHFVVSATVYAELRRDRQNHRAKEPSKTLIAFGDPTYPSATMTRNERALDAQDATLRSMLTRGYRLTPLPATRNEVTAIVDLYRGNAEAYVAERATEERAKGVARGTRYLHFASHGLLDERFPLNSGLALTIPEEMKEGQDNGILQAWEIFERVRIDADLVVLSACETGLGKELGGEGLIGLTRAFQYAGASSVLASLWSVADETTAALMKQFYDYLRAGRSKDVALRNAQLDLIRDSITVDRQNGRRSLDAAHPFYWAAFELNGDWR